VSPIPIGGRMAWPWWAMLKQTGQKREAMSNFDALTVRVPVSDKTPDAPLLKDADAETLVLFANLLDIALPGQTSEQSNATGQGQETVSDNLSPTAKFMSGPASEQVSSGLDETAGDPRLSGDEIMAFLTDAPQEGGDRLTRLLIVANQMLGSAELNALQHYIVLCYRAVWYSWLQVSASHGISE